MQTSKGEDDSAEELDARLRARWSGAADRLGLSPPAVALGEAMIAELLFPSAARELDRAGLLALARARGLDALRALAALAELEARDVVRACADDTIPWLSAPVALATRVREHVLGVPPPGTRHGRTLEVLPRLAAIIERLDPARGSLVVIQGRAGSGRDAILDALLARIGAGALVLTPGELARSTDRLEPEVSGRVAVWDARGTDPSPDDRARAAAWLSRSRPFAVAIADPDRDVPVVDERAVTVLASDPVDVEERRWCWSHALGGSPREADLAAALADQLRVGAGYAHRVVRSAAERGETLSVASARAAIEALVPPSSLRGIAVEHPDERLESLVLEPSVARGLRHLITLVRHRDAIGVHRRVGVKTLLSGPPGTGKTLAARALAAELGRPLHRVDLASVVSKWIGETEKNLARVFEAAEALGAVLVFEEGEALLGERGQVLRGADRYANLEVAYLLQALEAHDGVVVVTTNARNKIDPAFLRRFDVVLELGRPDATRRALLWKRELGDAAAELPAAFVSEIAHRSELTGGHIAAAARLARALAREAGRATVYPEDVLEALAFEHEKLGGAMAATRLRDEANGKSRWRS